MLNTLIEIIEDEETLETIENLKKAIQEYGIISKYTLQKIKNLNTNNIKECKEILSKIQEELGGKNFIEELEKLNKNNNEEIVIAIENIKK
ncbi:MAG TPA: hypothetical protein ENO30_05565 [Thermodesulfobium narugense]|nr:hypothetical protein [Thermodesulfobium narugense]